MTAWSIPSPSFDRWELGPFTIHVYALCIVAGIAAAATIGSRRWVARGGTSESFETVLLWSVPAGVVGARIYHVLTHAGDYFGPDHANPFAIWEGGLAIYGAVGGGALAAWVVARRRRMRFAAFADAAVPGIAVAQAIGRLGNWFNQELYGRPTSLPWGLEIDRDHRVSGYEDVETFHPTFLYELVWNLGIAGVLIWADRRFRLGRGKVFALYMALYGFGRALVESIRLDYSYDTFGPVRFNAAMAALICLAGLVLFVWLCRYRPGREDVVEATVPGPGGIPDACEDVTEDAEPDADDVAPDDPAERTST